MVMGSVSLRHEFFFTTKNPLIEIHSRKRICWRAGRFRSGLICSKLSDFQDFQGYAKPLRLLPVEKVKIFPGKQSIDVGLSRSLYKVKLQTSNVFGSTLSDLNSRVLLCLIDEKGDSILQTIPANWSNNLSSEPKDIDDHESLGFQRGSTDEFVFEGPKLGEIKALWISLESGQWRLGGVSLSVINSRGHISEENNGEKSEYVGFQYDFETDDILLGEGSELSMVELRPILVTKLSGSDSLTLLHENSSQSTSNYSPQLSNEESMKEYAELKFSLLLYDAILTLLGTLVLSFSLWENSAIAFFVGGISGFCYLLLLQRSVDGLQVPGTESENPEGKSGQMSRGIKGPLLSLALAIGFSALAMKSNIKEEFAFVLAPKEILVGVMGFLVCKVAVVLAAFKPIPLGLRQKE